MNTVEFLQELYRGIPNGYAEIRLIHEEKHFIKQLYRPMPVTDVNPQGIARLHEFNQVYHVYHRMAISREQRSTKTDIMLLPAIWLDIDDCSPDAYNKLLAMEFYPNIIVHSGGGFHAYWLLITPVATDSESAIFEIERTMEGMQFDFGGAVDPKAKDITRILRTPGFYNIKAKYGEKRLARVVFFDEARYQFETLHKRFAPLGKPKPAQITRYVPTEAYTSEYPKWVQNYLKYGRAEGKRNAALYGAALELRACGFSQGQVESDLIMRAVADGLEQSEAVKTISSAYRRDSVPAAKQLPSHMATFMAVEDSTGGVK